MAAHQIRLAGPWELLTAQFEMGNDVGSAGVDASGRTRSIRNRCQPPFDASEFAMNQQPRDGCVRLSRGFHRPAGLTDLSDVFLVFLVNHTPVHAFLNDQRLATEEMTVTLADSSELAADPTEPRPAESLYHVSAPITAVLRPFNKLIVELRSVNAAGFADRLISVVLEIHESRSEAS